MKSRVSVIGLGYMGLPTAIILAENELTVFGYDIDEEKINKIKKAEPVINEPEIIPRLQSVLDDKEFSVSNKLHEAEYYIISVPTPVDKNKNANLDAVWSATSEVAKILKHGDTVILESTSIVGTTEKLSRKLEEITNLKAGIDFFVGYSPERAIPGNTFYEVVHNNRIIGGINKESSNKIFDLYSKFVKSEISITDSKTAEMVKLVENSSRDVQIAFSNQVASIAYQQGINPYDLIALANKHPRVNILNPRCGVGGHCIAIDPWFLVEAFPEHTKLLKAAREINDAKPLEVINFVEDFAERYVSTDSYFPTTHEVTSDKRYTMSVEALAKSDQYDRPIISRARRSLLAESGSNSAGIVSRDERKKINLLVLGLTFKPDVDDLRESPALEIVEKLSKKENFNLTIADPNINKSQIDKNLQKNFVDNFETGLENADIILVLVGHREFRDFDWSFFPDKKILDFSGLNIKEAIMFQASNEATFQTKIQI